MNLWKVELLRLIRTRRILILFAIFIIFGFGEPLLTRYLPDIISHSSNASSSNIKITVISKPTAAQGFAGYIGELNGLGLIVTLIIAAYTLAIDSRASLSAFYRTREVRMTRLLLPRFIVISSAVVAAFVVGTLTAWYETTAVLGHSAAHNVLYGILFTSLYLVFCMAAVALAASIVRSTMATVGLAFAILLLAPILETVKSLARWMPTTLSSSMSKILDGNQTAAYFVKPSIVAAVCIVVFLGMAARRLQAREIEE